MDRLPHRCVVMVALGALVAISLLPVDGGAGERTAESRERLAKAESLINEWFDAMRKVRASKTMDEWEQAHKKCGDVGLRFRDAASETGVEAFEAFEAAVLKGIEEWDRLGLEWGDYRSAAAVDRPDIGRRRINAFLQNPKLTMRMKTDILRGLPSSSQPEEWLDERVILKEIRQLFESTKEFCRQVERTSEGSKSTSVRFCDAGLEMAYWYAPASVPRIDLMKSDFPERDLAIAAARKWVEARLRLWDLREALLGTVRDYRALQLDKAQLSASLELWKNLEKRRTPANFRDMKSLADILLVEMKERRDTGRKAGETDRHFQREAVRALQGLFKDAGHELPAPKGDEMDAPGPALLWLHDAAMEASKNARTPFLRQEWKIFAEGL